MLNTFLQAVYKLEKSAPVIRDAMKNYSSKEACERVIQLIEEMAK